MPIRTPNQQFATDPPVFQQARTVTHSKIFWLSMDLAFTGAANELKTAFTDPQGFSVIVRSAWSDILGARVRFTVSAEKR